MIAVILIFYRQKDKHRTIMERKQTKRIIIFLLLLLGIILPNMAQKQKIWKAFCDKCRREKNHCRCASFAVRESSTLVARH